MRAPYRSFLCRLRSIVLPLLAPSLPLRVLPLPPHYLLTAERCLWPRGSHTQQQPCLQAPFPTSIHTHITCTLKAFCPSLRALTLSPHAHTTSYCSPAPCSPTCSLEDGQLPSQQPDQLQPGWTGKPPCSLVGWTTPSAVRSECLPSLSFLGSSPFRWGTRESFLLSYSLPSIIINNSLYLASLVNHVASVSWVDLDCRLGQPLPSSIRAPSPLMQQCSKAQLWELSLTYWCEFSRPVMVESSRSLSLAATVYSLSNIQHDRGHLGQATLSIAPHLERLWWLRVTAWLSRWDADDRVHSSCCSRQLVIVFI